MLQSKNELEKMTSRTKYAIIIISIIGLIFLVFSAIKWRYWGLEHLLIAKISYIIGFVSFVLYFSAKEWRKVLTKVMLFTFSISLVLSLYLSYKYYEWNQYIQTRNEYEEIATCDGLKERFAIDLEKNEIKYFQFGFGPDNDLQKKLHKKYGIESFGMGCVVDPKIECYNQLVNLHLKEKYNDSILDN